MSSATASRVLVTGYKRLASRWTSHASDIRGISFLSGLSVSQPATSRFISHSALGTNTPEDSFKATRICTKSGEMESIHLTPSEILARTSILPRDLVSLALSTRNDRNKRLSRLLTENTMRHPPAAILPRKDCILLSFGSIRAVAGRENVYIFDTHSQVTKSFAEHLSQVYPQRAVNHDVREKYC